MRPISQRQQQQPPPKKKTVAALALCVSRSLPSSHSARRSKCFHRSHATPRAPMETSCPCQGAGPTIALTPLSALSLRSCQGEATIEVFFYFQLPPGNLTCWCPELTFHPSRFCCCLDLHFLLELKFDVFVQNIHNKYIYKYILYILLIIYLIKMFAST